MTRTPAATLSLALLFSAAGCGKSADGKASPDSGRPPALQAEVAAQRTARELERTVKPKDAGLSTQQGLDEAKSVEEAARAGAAAAKAQLAMTQTRLAKAVVRAPIDDVEKARSDQDRVRGTNVEERAAALPNPSAGASCGGSSARDCGGLTGRPHPFFAATGENGAP